MKHIVKLIIILSFLSPVCHAQKIETEEEYKVFHDSIVSKLKLAEKKANNCAGKPFSELVKHLDKNGIKIMRAGIDYDTRKLYPEEVYGLRLYFTTPENNRFAWIHDLEQPFIIIEFDGSKPFEKALSLTKKYQSCFEKEVEAFYSDAVIKSINFYDLDTNNIYKRIRILRTKSKSNE